MSPIRLLIITGVLVSSSSAIAQEERGLRPLDRRTRCVVLFRESLILVSKKDVDGVLVRVADGGPPNQFKVFPDGASASPVFKRVAENPEEFFQKNFSHAETMLTKFDDILFSDLTAANESVTVTDAKDGKKQDGKLYSMRIQIPGVTDQRFTSLSFVEAGRRIYWVPFGW